MLVPAPHWSADCPRPTIPQHETSLPLAPFQSVSFGRHAAKTSALFSECVLPYCRSRRLTPDLFVFLSLPSKTHLSRHCCHSFLLENERLRAALEAICHQGGLIGAQSRAPPASQVGISWSSRWPDGMSDLIRRTRYL